ncbi:MAG: alpha-2-macroglobulin family protein, partial [Dokdonella sp.]
MAGQPVRPELNASIDGTSVMLHFSEPMLTWAGKGTPSGVSFAPPLPCQWYWSNDTQLICDTDYRMRDLHRATRYQLSVRGGFWSQRDVEVGQQVLALDSERPALEAAISDWRNGQPMIGIETNVSVTAAALRRALSLSLEDGGRVDFELQNQTATEPNAYGPRMKWRIALAPVTGSNRILTLRVVPGLHSDDGELTGLQDKVLLRARLNEPFRLRIVVCGRTQATDSKPHATPIDEVADADTTIQCPAGEQVALAFSDALSPASRDGLRAHLPAGLRLENADDLAFHPDYGNAQNVSMRPGHFIRLFSSKPGHALSFEVPDSLTSDTGASIERASRITLESSDYLPQLEVKPALILMPTHARAPEIFSAVNQPAMKVEQHGLGGSALSTDKAVLRPTPLNAIVRLAPPEPGRDVREHGGLVQGVVLHDADTSGNRYYPGRYNQSFGVDYAAFNITASVADNQYLVWVTDWDHAGAVGNASVELLQSTAANGVKVLATATTDADGVATFDRPRSAEQKRRQLGGLLLRATRDGQRAIMPIDQSPLPNHRESDYRSYNRLSEGERRSWGVTDRPLYRPGDTVHYRLWIRERQQNHLRLAEGDASATFVLAASGSNQVVSTFKAALDKYGSAMGELQLPATLHDNDYCIRLTDQSRYMEGACFRMTGYHLNELWAELHVDHELANAGDSVTLDASSGYYSGGPAVGAKTEFQSLLSPLRLEDAYPAFREFTFVDPFLETAGFGGESFSGQMPSAATTDAQGHVRIDVKLSNEHQREGRQEKPIPFGTLEFTTSVSTSPSSWASSAPATLRLSRHPKFVGLKLNQWMLREDEDAAMQALVITAAGVALPDVPVHVRIDEVKAADEDVANKDEPLARCELVSGKPATCAFRPPHSGLYGFRASSEGAVDTAVERYAFIGSKRIDSDADRVAKLIVTGGPPTAGTDTQLMLQQPFAQAQVLFTIEHGRVFKHWVQHVNAPVASISVPLESAWAPGVTINATVLDASGPAFGPHASRGKLVQSASADLKIAAMAGNAPLTLALDRTQARPRDDVIVTLKNASADRRQVTLAIVDDAARALVPELSAATDPASERWLGGLSAWDTPDWYGLAAWQRAVGTTSAYASSMFNFDDSGEKLETITVTGSNITAADIFVRNPTSDHSLGRPALGSKTAAVALRSQFRESALWKTDLELEPGASTEVSVRLPDNLTRWRVLAWSANESDGFGYAQATIEAALPLEMRVDAPTRLFPGDSSVLAASVRNHTAVASSVSAKLGATGAGIVAATSWQGTIAANTEHRLAIDAQPQVAGRIELDARGVAGSASDGVSGSVEVASAVVHQHMPVAGWLPTEGVHLRMAALPAGATHPRIRVEAGRGLMPLAASWIDALRDYPHRCWEQVLSRAVGAAAAKRLGLGSSWEDADAVIREALTTAGQYQDDSGQFHFFVGDNGDIVSAPSLYLTAYTVQGFAFLHELGYDIPLGIDRNARKALGEALATPYPDLDGLAAAAALAAEAKAPASALDLLWNSRARLNWFARANLARVFADVDPPDERARQLLDELREAGTQHGARRVIERSPDSRWAFASTTLDQCGVLDALVYLDHASDADRVQREYLRGLADLYAGGAPVLNTQSEAQCLMALVHSPGSSSDGLPLRVDVTSAATNAHVDIAAGKSTAEWSADFTALPPALDVQAKSAGDALISFVASIEYDIDGRHSTPAATAFGLERRYSVLRDHAWSDVASTAIREGDWVRVTLRLANNDTRHFVAITDTVAGGLRPMDLELASVAGVDMRELGS